MNLRELQRHVKIVPTPENRNIHVLDVGNNNAPAVMLVHGFAGAWKGWKDQIDFLCQKGLRVIAPDMDGHGNTPHTPHDTILSYVEDLEGIRNWLHVRTVHLVGHSYGGAVAQAYAIQHPEHVASLTLLSSFAQHPTFLKWAAAVGARLHRAFPGRANEERFIDEILQSGPETTKQNGFENIAHTPEAQNVISRVINHIQKNWVYEDPERAQRELRGIPPADPKALIDYFNATANANLDEKIEANMTILHSEKDRIIPASAARQLQRIHPQARLILLPGNSHVIHREKADDVNNAIFKQVFGEDPRAFWKKTGR
ncbi:MAG: alpha/beta hydrolase [Candidatus Micrarchaeota archaeon]|nr:alpha/beta hydrolase [Candidatus Micrarchaeota archaeon]